MKRSTLLISLLFLTGAAFAQPKKTTLERPKLVVGIVVDQMRYDYLYRFYDKYSEGGFKRLMREGFNARNNHYHYAATYTGPGHAHIYNGSAPALSGIVGNDWYDRKANRLVYCTEDTTVQTVGNTGSAGKMSPRNMRVSNLGDQLKIATQGRSKVIGIALKDRGAILPAGHAANAAYWFDSKDGNWISSTFYMNDLPAWVKALNARRLPDQYNAQQWTPLLPLNQYAESTADDVAFEGTLQGEPKAVFPHTFAAAMGLKYEELRTSPFGDQLTKEMALAALKGENLGKNAQTDMLCVSFSSTDYIGHRFGSESVEVEDEYLRLDRVMAELLNAFDAQVGKGNYLVFLSADHGAAHTPGYLQSLHIPAGTREYNEVSDAVKRAMEVSFGAGDWLKRYQNQQLYLNTDLLVQKKVSMEMAFAAIRAELLKTPGIVNVYNLHNVAAMAMPENVRYQLNNVFDPNRCGDFYILFNPNYIEGFRKGGTTHGTTYNYDTHVPFLLYGWGVKPGETTRRTYIHDIAPTVTALLHLIEPNGNIGNPVQEALR
ncbi:alkaline phosphatase PafA [Tellurirhabdus rosea]|uniref:alkaline phosphatase PafA n=1 Tax=Tellurirhabdus rosea TaxID=2674997 RepID=UPI002256B5C4|nr:alkaline phosphatase PafA [Tellurirhabdus rosea]